MQNRKFKKLSTFIAATMLSVVTIGTTAFASPQLLFDSEEGIGIEVHCSNPNARGDIEDNYTSVAGGMLWTTWRNGKTYRANYDHSSKEHRCTALNGDGVSSRSAWTAKGITARSGFIPQTIINNKSDKIAKGIYIKGVDVSNLSKEDAINKISEHINSSIPDDLTLIHDDYETSISSESIEINFNLEEAVNIAYDIGKTGNIFENNINILKTLISNINIEPAFSINDNQLISELKDISAKLPDKMIESSYYIDGTNLIITKGNTGCAVNIDESYNTIKNKIYNLDIKNSIELSTLEQSPTEINLDNIYSEIHKEPVNAYYTQNPFSVFPSENGVDFAISLDEAKQLLNSDSNECTIPLKVLYPSITTNMIGTEAFPDLLSEFSTNYSVSNKNRTTNLILAANKINGTVVMPGETFSYNKVVGARTIAAGYKEAPIYVSGKVVDGLGGGICQITTTLYNAVLLSNLEIVERSNHQFVPSYANASRDATVVYGAIDFKFKNNREYPIKITCSVSKGIANFKIWGLKSDNDYEVVLSSRVTGSNANYLYSEGYKTLKKDGQIVSTEVISKDVYKRH